MLGTAALEKRDAFEEEQPKRQSKVRGEQCQGSQGGGFRRSKNPHEERKSKIKNF